MTANETWTAHTHERETIAAHLQTARVAYVDERPPAHVWVLHRGRTAPTTHAVHVTIWATLVTITLAGLTYAVTTMGPLTTLAILAPLTVAFMFAAVTRVVPSDRW